MTHAASFRPTRLTTIDPNSLVVGTPLPPETLRITTTLIVCGAIASRDFFPGHHDAGAARVAGQPDVFMNIMTTGGLLGRFLTDWAGPEAVLESLDLRLGVANLPGDTMTTAGEISAIERAEESCAITVTLRGINDRGRHADATAVVRIPITSSTPEPS